MSASDERERLEAEIWRVLGEYSKTPRVHHVQRICDAADRYAHASAESGYADAVARVGRATVRPSRCTWWSDPSDDFYGMCVKEAGHDREGLDDEREHENAHGIRWSGQRWEPSPRTKKPPMLPERTGRPA